MKVKLPTLVGVSDVDAVGVGKVAQEVRKGCDNKRTSKRQDKLDDKYFKGEIDRKQYKDASKNNRKSNQS